MEKETNKFLPFLDVLVKATVIYKRYFTRSTFLKSLVHKKIFWRDMIFFQLGYLFYQAGWDTSFEFE